MTRPNRDLVAIDLFSGPGGMTQGLKDAGFRVVGAVEVDGLAADTYALNHDEVRIWRKDIRTVDANKMRRELSLRRGRLDLLACCPPCQGFSTIRTRRRRVAVKDDRNNLIDEVVRFVAAFEPKALLLENVPGLERRSRYKAFRKALAALGYKTRDRVVDAQEFGVPQRRRRLLLVATRRGRRPPIARSGSKRVTVQDAIGTLTVPGSSGDELHDLPERRSDKVKKIIAAIPKDGGSRSALGKENQLACHIRLDGFHDVYGRMAWARPSPTITGGCVNPSKGRFLHPDQDRAITLREAALLQSFPPKYRFSLARGKLAAAEMIGNALPPLLVQQQASAIALVLRARPRLRSAKSKLARARKRGIGADRRSS